MAWCEVSDRRIWYEDQGAGEPIVLLHGWCMSSRVWNFQAETLKERFRVIRPDFAGHGHSDPPAPGGCSFNGLAGDVDLLLERLDLKRVVLVGWSMGAQVALQLCSRAGERMAALALVGGTPRFQSTSDFPHGLQSVEVEGMALKVRRNIHRALAGFTDRMFAPGELVDAFRETGVAELLAEIPAPETAVALECLTSLAVEDLRGLLPKTVLPSLVVNGDRDQICLPEASTYMAERLSGATHVVFEGCGHAPFLSRPELFNECLVRLWRRVRGAG